MEPQAHPPFRLAPHRPWARILLLPALVCASTLWACSSDSAGPSPDPSVPTTLTALEGLGLSAPAGTVLPEGPTVEVRDQYGDLMEGVPVTFQVLEGEGTVVHTVRETNAWGQARVPWVLGPVVGSAQRLKASFSTLVLEFQATAVEATPGERYLGRNGYTEYLPGELPLVLSAPHGGSQVPAEIPDRTWGTTGSDRNTRELAHNIREAVKNLTGYYPHIILSNLHRIKLDPNREIVEAAQGDPEAERAWWEFQTFIEAAEDIVEDTFGEGFYIDLHGHGHAIQRIELGYLLSSNDLANTDEVLSGPEYVNKSSLRALGQKPWVTLAELVRGPMSLGTLLELEEYPTVPSETQHNPGSDPYFSGGYNTAQHGSRDGGTVSGVQIECNFTGVRDTQGNRIAFAEALARALDAYFPAHYHAELRPLQTPMGK